LPGRRRLPFLRNQASLSQMLDVMGQCRRRQANLCLELTYRHAFVTSTDQCAIDLETHRATQGLKLAGCCFEFHGNNKGTMRV